MIKRLLSALLIAAALPNIGAAQVQQGDLAETSTGWTELTVNFRRNAREIGIYVLNSNVYAWSKEEVAEKIAAGAPLLNNIFTSICVYIEGGGTFAVSIDAGAFSAPGLSLVPVDLRIVQFGDIDYVTRGGAPPRQYARTTQRQRETFFEPGFTAYGDPQCNGMGTLDVSHRISVTPHTPTQAGVYTSSLTLTVIPD